MTSLWPTPCIGCAALGDARLCPRCTPTAVWQIPPPDPHIHQAWALSRYRTPYGRAVATAKANSDRHLAKRLTTPFVNQIGPMIAGAPITAIVPAPSTAWNLWRRGFSLAALAAAELAARTGHPLTLALHRRGGSKQTQLDATARKHNLEGKLRCRLPMHGVVLLVDDVLTTGATASACAAALRGAGATEVRFATLCAVPPPDPVRERWTDPSESGM